MRRLSPCHPLSMLGIVAVLLGAPATVWSEPLQPGPAERRHVLEAGLYLGALFPPKTHELFSLEAYHKPLDAAAFDVGLRLSYLPIPYLGLEVEGGVMPATLEGVDESALIYTFRGHVIGQYPALVTPFLVAGYGLLGVSSGDQSLGDDLDGAFHAGLGAKYEVIPRLTVRLDGRMILSGKLGPTGYMPHWEALASVSYAFFWKDARPDGDGDGVVDVLDACPNKPANTTDGCPPDKDGDGIPDADDKCPDKVGPAPDGCPPDKDGDGVPDAEDKCPDKAGVPPDGCPPDKDGDGIPDAEDKCPDKAGPAPQGCPPDKDGDGVPDAEDKCPDKVGVPPDGCPPDKDGDGVPDADDKCPDQPETVNNYLDDDGCPDTVPRRIKRFAGTLKGIHFALDKDEIKESSFRLLDLAVKVLGEFPDLRLMIRGHADETGTEAHNLDLSRRRALSVKRYLVGKGVDTARIDTEGLGSSEPLTTGRSAAARAKNRRIEFKVLQGTTVPR